ncbi:hypothetical protein B0A48_05747 [Cryoendolithus antarcticus]|uniref:Presequence translocated-associated motor subunit PAM17 n=1 Tax=Cryoendolithus antarcticus TaxID=1507870 RepID=A0A1V8TBT8_9PEZI|nr:hypothetical protein B0A48_05747 [Cryoendolithus antarcticus]
MATILCPRASCLRVATHGARSLTIQPPVKPFYPSTGRTIHQVSNLSRQPLTSWPQPRKLAQILPTLSVRNASTSTPAAAPSLPVPEGTTTQSPIPPTTSPTPTLGHSELLTWNRFFELRRKRRWVSTGASVLTAVGTVVVAVPIINAQDIDTWGAQISGMDPMIVLGVTTIGVALLGWLAGPTFGNAGFGVWAARRGWKSAITEKEKSFYARIRRYRADPSASSPQNPIPDYYGEKIKSVQDYRRWLKDQRAFNRKKNRSLL